MLGCVLGSLQNREMKGLYQNFKDLVYHFRLKYQIVSAITLAIDFSNVLLMTRK